MLLILRDAGQCHRDTTWFRHWYKLLPEPWMQALYEPYVYQAINFHNWSCPNKTERSQSILLWPFLPVPLLEGRTSLSGRLFFIDGIFSNGNNMKTRRLLSFYTTVCGNKKCVLGMRVCSSFIVVISVHGLALTLLANVIMKSSSVWTFRLVLPGKLSVPLPNRLTAQ